MIIPEEVSLEIKSFFSNYWPLILILIISILIAYISVAFLGHDNPIESEVEKLIEIETGLKIDLTP